ncbi:MAG: acetyl-CoA carboxylase carboxyltransferase subunit alpha [Planctomycetes bacterium]|nr:acetyl-CoA carboxylase carboxyltransferase subunit alpha [Planctomycetota bacterium]
MSNSNLDFEKPIIELERRILELESKSQERNTDLLALNQMRETLGSLIGEIFSKLNAWERVQVARHPERPQTSDYLSAIFDDFVELHGDRYFHDDPAVKVGLARLEGRSVVVIGQHKGKDTRQRLAASYGMSNPEGYRKALRLMKLAEKLKIPVVCLIDTPGAFPGVGAEERGQFSAIAVNLMEMARLRTPTIGIILAEGGSGGALGIAVLDRLLILENAWFSVISPEGCAAILFKSSEKDKIARAAEALKLTSVDLVRLNVVDEIVPEPLGGAHRDPPKMAETLKGVLVRNLQELEAMDVDELLDRRYEKWRSIGRIRPAGEDEEAPEGREGIPDADGGAAK